MAILRSLKERLNKPFLSPDNAAKKLADINFLVCLDLPGF
jgi:hypothetical protein